MESERQDLFEAPSVRLDHKVSRPDAQTFDAPHPAVRLAHIDGAQGDCTLKGEKGVTQIIEAPALLVSYYYLGPFLKEQHRYRYRDWVMDSGAFSAHNSGVAISLSEYIDTCLELLEKDASLTEVFALDVIGDAEASLKNAEEMWRQKVPAIPCYHAGEPEEFLFHLAQTYPKIALGGVALERGDFKFKFCEQCFARVWPKKIHGFGMSSPEIVFNLPFHSVDATNWELAPCAFGNWEKYGTMSVRGSNQDLRSQVKHYMEMEQKARVRWVKEMELLERLEPTRKAGPPPTVRLAVDAGAAGGLHAVNAFGKTGEAEKKNTAAPVRKVAPKQKPEPALTGELDQKWCQNWWE